MPPLSPNSSFEAGRGLFPAAEKRRRFFSNPRLPQGGFSLVEVTLALGIMGFAAVSIIGLVSVGLDHSRRNMERSVEAQILDTARARAKAAYEEGKLASLSGGGPLFFNSDGLALKPAAPAVDRLFSATLAPQEKGLPGSEQALWGVAITIRACGRDNRLLASHAVWFSK